MEIYVWFCLNSQTNTEFVIVILLRQVAKQTLRSWWWLFKLFFTGISETWFGYIYRGRSNVPTYEPWFWRDLFVLIPATFGLCFKHTCSGGRNGRLTVWLAVLGIFHLLRDRFISSVPLRQASIYTSWNVENFTAKRQSSDCLFRSDIFQDIRSIPVSQTKEKQRCWWSVKNPALLITSLLFVIREMLTLCKSKALHMSDLFLPSSDYIHQCLSFASAEQAFWLRLGESTVSSSITNTATFTNNKGSDV